MEMVTSVVAPTSACWEWQGSRNSGGYGLVSNLTHRLAFQAAFGRIPAGMQLDHLCRNRACYNPTHLEAVTPRENVLRSRLGRHSSDRCQRGHDTLVPRRDSTSRRCTTCERLRDHARRRRQPVVR